MTKSSAERTHSLQEGTDFPAPLSVIYSFHEKTQRGIPEYCHSQQYGAI